MQNVFFFNLDVGQTYTTRQNLLRPPLNLDLSNTQVSLDPLHLNFRATHIRIIPLWQAARKVHVLNSIRFTNEIHSCNSIKVQHVYYIHVIGNIYVHNSTTIALSLIVWKRHYEMFHVTSGL